MRNWIVRLVIVAVIAGAVWAGYKVYQAMPQRQQQIASTKVRQSDVTVRSFTRGELRAVRSVTLIAPNLFGTVQVTRLASLGSFAREKNLIAEFDDAEVRSRLEEKQLEIDQVEEQLKKSQADLAIRNNQDQVELLRTRYSVRRAELEVKRNELLSAIDAKKNQLNLEESKRRLQQLESDIKSRQEQAQAELAVLQEKRSKARLELAREAQRLSQVKLLAPMSGLVAVRQNRTGMFFPGMQIPDIREGDQIQPGIPVADVLDLSELEIVAKVGELDRANLKEGQSVIIRLDAVGDKQFRGAIKSMSGTASANIFSGDPAKKFDVVFSVDMKELLTSLGAPAEQIRRVLETAEQNRKRPVNPMAMAGGMGGAPGAMPPGAMPGGATMTRTTGPGGGAAPGPPTAAPGAPASSAARGGLVLFSNPAGEVARPGQRTAPAKQAGGGEGQRERRAGGGAGREGRDPLLQMRRSSPFTDKEMADAQLPPEVEATNQLGVLLRPGLLADVEIILEQLPNAINIPLQAMFEKDGKNIVYVKTGNSWAERVVTPRKRTESIVVVADGLKPGEMIAMSDPNARPSDKPEATKGGAMSGVSPGR